MPSQFPELLVSITNDLTLDSSGWAQIAPMGDFPGMALVDDGRGGTRKVKAIQRIDREAVTSMVHAFKASRQGFKRFLNGCPIYVGHPDVPGCESKYPDPSPKGVFADIAERNGAFCGVPVFTNEGCELVETRQYRALSGRWFAEACGEVLAAGGEKIPVFRPTRFISAGLTNQPNLPVQLLNESDPPAPSTMKKKIIALCATLGITLTNDATDEQTEAALDQIGRQAASALAFANEKSGLESALQSRDASLASLTSERDASRAQFANERAARISDLLDSSVLSGRISLAERPQWETRLKSEANFANECDALRKLRRSAKTQSVTLTRGSRKVELTGAQDRRELLAELVNEVCEQEGLDVRADYDIAFARVQRRFPQLFDAMRQPPLPAAKQ